MTLLALASIVLAQVFPIPGPGPTFPVGPPPETLSYDASSEGTGTSSLSWTHSPVGAIEGVVVFCITNGTSTDVISGATYGGSAMTFVARAADATTEPGSTEAYFLGSSIPTGNQTVVCTVSSGTNAKHGVAVGFNTSGSSNTALAGDGSCTVNDNVTNPTCNIANQTTATMAAGGVFSGVAAPSSITPGTGYSTAQDNDFGATSSEVEVMNAEQASGTVTVNFGIGNDDVAMVGVAIKVSP